MKVRATRKGFYVKRREPGDEFDYSGDKPASWMEQVKPGPKPKAEKPKAE